MGNSDNKQNQIQKKYVIIEENKELGQFVLESKNNKSKFIMKSNNLTDQHSANFYTNQFKQKLKLIHPNYLTLSGNTFLIDFYITQQKSFCSNIYKVCSIFDMPNLSMIEQISNRKQENKFFSLKQLWSIVCTITIVLSHLNNHNISHGSIGVSSLFITNNGTITLADPELIPNEITYPSPQKYSHNQIYSKDHKSDVYSLGMTMLQIALLEPSTDCYENDYTINYGKVQDKLNKICSMYNQLLASLIASMLMKKPQERPDSLQLEEALSQILQTQDIQKTYLQNSVYFHSQQHTNVNQLLSTLNEEIQNPARQMYRDHGDRCSNLQYPSKEQVRESQPDQNIDFDKKNYDDESKIKNKRKLANKTFNKNVQFDKAQAENNFFKNNHNFCHYPLSQLDPWKFNYDPSSKQLYTDPKLLQLAKKQLEVIQQRSRIRQSRISEEKKIQLQQNSTWQLTHMHESKMQYQNLQQKQNNPFRKFN